LATTEKALKAKRSELKSTAKAGDLIRYDKLRKEEEKLIVRVNNLRREIRHNQRDIDGTKTGMKVLDEQIASSDDNKAMKELESRKSQAEALRMSRSHALSVITSERKPLLRIAA
jgi:chromosome segregation ATPase